MTAPQAPAYEYLEHLLQGRDATIDRALAWLHRSLQGKDAGRVRRIELRYAAQSRPPIDKSVARSRVVELCRQIGLVGVDVSVRVHQLPIDNDLGHLRLRLGLEPQPIKEAETPIWQRWRSKVRAKLWGLDDDELDGTAEAQSPFKVAVATLQRGLDVAVQQHPAAGKPEAAAVQGLHVLVYEEDLHRSLAPRMPPADTHNASLWLARELRLRGLQADPNWQVRYEYRAPPSDSTLEVSPDALSVRLLLAGDAMPSAARARQTPEPGDTPLPEHPDETPLPKDENHAAPPAPGVILRVLGTWQDGALQPLPAPFEASLGGLPTQFSRSMLEVLGFSATPHAALAGAASNRTPLGFAADGQGGIKLHTAARPGGQAMYHFVADGKPCLGEHPLTGPLQLVVNGPAPLQNGLWPLVIEVLPAGGKPA